MATCTERAPSMEEIFRARLNNIEERAKAAGLTLTAICRRSGIARATPDRWRKDCPLSIKLIDRMEQEVAAQEAAGTAGGQ